MHHSTAQQTTRSQRLAALGDCLWLDAGGRMALRPTLAAEQMGVKISTVRTHVSEMYEKTGTHSQAQLVARLHSS